MEVVCGKYGSRLRNGLGDGHLPDGEIGYIQELWRNCLLVEIHFNDRKPEETSFNGSFWIYWIYPACNQEYSALIKDVITENKSCPYCGNRRVLPGFNSFAAKHSELMKEWYVFPNYLLADADQMSGSRSTQVWWQCPKSKEHAYKMSPKKRLLFQKRHREPCPDYKGRRRKKRHFV